MGEASNSRPVEDRLMRTDEVALLIGVTAHTIGSWVRAGRIPSKRLGGSRRFVRAEIEEWIRNGGVASESGNSGEAE